MLFTAPFLTARGTGAFLSSAHLSQALRTLPPTISASFVLPVVLRTLTKPPPGQLSTSSSAVHSLQPKQVLPWTFWLPSSLLRHSWVPIHFFSTFFSGASKRTTLNSNSAPHSLSAQALRPPCLSLAPGLKRQHRLYFLAQVLSLLRLGRRLGHSLRVPKRFPMSSRPLVPHLSKPSLGHQFLCASASAS